MEVHGDPVLVKPILHVQDLIYYMWEVGDIVQWQSTPSTQHNPWYDKHKDNHKWRQRTLTMV